MREKNKNNKSTIEISKLLKVEANAPILDDDLKDLEDTREFRKIENKNGEYVTRYSPNINHGLSYSQVERRIKEGLTNDTKDKNKKSVLGIICKNVFTFLNVLLFVIFLLLIVSQINKPFELKNISNYFFMVIILTNLLIGIYQEIKAKVIVDRLALSTKNKIKVLRDGEIKDLYSEDLVLDDIVLLSVGQKIVADSVVIEGSVEVNESLLTGESLPVKKNVGEIVFAGTFVSSGSCKVKVERVGNASYVSLLQQRAKKEKKTNSIILRSLNLIIRLISLLVVPFGIYSFLTGWWKFDWTSDFSILQQLLSQTCGSMVAMIPSGLYLTTSVSLFLSIITLAQKNTLVQDAYSIEMLARTDCLCLDKTGTITDGTMNVVDEISLNESNYNLDEVIGDLLDSFEDKNLTSVALLKAHPSVHKYEVIEKLPFSSSRKKCGVKFSIGSFVLGAPEFIIPEDKELLTKFEEYTSQGLRVLILGTVEDLNSEDIVGKVTPLKAYLIKDHIRDEAPATLKWFSDNGVEVKIISGDNALTVSQIAKEAGVPNADKYISLEDMSLDEVSKIATEYNVFGRVAPEQKATLVTALKKAGKTVGMTGDGVNDILALKRADCSIAMASGSDAAKNVSSIVLIDSNFASLPKVVSEGRRVINNITAVSSLFLMKTIFAFIVTMSTLYKFQPSFLMLLEFFSIGVPSFLLAISPNDAPIKKNFLKNILINSVPGGISYALGIIILIIFNSYNVFNINPSQDMNITTTICGIYISIMGIITLFYHCFPLNKYRVGVYSLMVIGTIISIFTPINKFVGYNPYALNFYQWLIVICAIILGTLFYIGFKYLNNRFFNKQTKGED